MKLHVSAFIGHLQVSTILKKIYESCKNCVSVRWLRDLCINPLITQFVVQKLYVNREKIL